MPGEARERAARDARERAGFWRSLGAALRQALRSRTRLEAFGLLPERQAAQRATALLVRCLDEAQRAEFQRTRGFTLTAPSGRRYRITFGATANIDMVSDTGEIVCRLCARPLEVPVPAVMLAQKLMLETQEAEFLRVAARHEVLGATRHAPAAEYVGI